MNKLFLLLTVIVQDSITLEESPLCQIQQFTERTAINTTFDFWWDGFNILIAVIALLFSVFTFISQNKTSENTQKLSREAQKNLLLDLVRHFYRNLVITYTIKYEVMHDLYLKLRNYNEEVNVACTHFKDANLSKETKKRDLDTLLLKPSFLTERILITMYELWDMKQVSNDFNKGEYRNRIIGLLKDTRTTLAAKGKIAEAQNGNSNSSNNTVKTTDYLFEPYANDKSCYAEILFGGEEWPLFVKALNRDVYVERGKNSQGGDKVYIIPLK